MRRFELSEGTSNKFWQVEREECALRVHFGRIGTAGQSQSKTFATEALAQAEIDKLVKEKLKKGYVEVGAAAAPAPSSKREDHPHASVAVPATPVANASAGPTPAAPPPPDCIAWNDEARSAVAPIRGSSRFAADPPDGKALYAKLRAAMTAASPQLDAGEKLLRAKQTVMRMARKAFAASEPEAPLDLDTQAAAYALIGWDDATRPDEFMGFWTAREGAAFALRARVQGASLSVDADREAVAIVEGESQADSWARHGCAEWRSLRKCAVLASDAEHAALVAEAESLARAATSTVRAVLAAAFERPQWAASDLAGLAKDGLHLWVWALLVSMPDAQAALSLYETLRAVHSPWEVARRIGELRFDLLARYGSSGAPLFVKAVADADDEDGGRGHVAQEHQKRELADALALLTASEVADFFATRLAAKELLRPVAASYLTAHPDIAIRALAAVASQANGAPADAARALLGRMLAWSGDAVAVGKAALQPRERGVVADLEAQLWREEAALGDLPPALATPPWTRKATVPRPVAVALTPLPYTESMTWKPGEAERRQAGWTEHASPATTIARIRAANAGDAPSVFSATAFLGLPKKDLLETLPAIDLTRFNWSFHKVAPVLVARHGVEVIEFALRSAACDTLGAVEALDRANAARVAPLMADAFVRLKNARATAAEWLATFPEAAAVGLIPEALGPPGKPRQAAETALRYVASRGHRATIEQVATRYGQAAAEGTRAVLDFDPLLALPARLPKMPEFWRPRAFTRPLLAGGKRALPLAAVDAIGTMLAFSTLERPYQGILDVKVASDARSVADFAWDVFDAWLLAGAPPKEGWALTALGLLGDDTCARKLAPLVRAWPGDGFQARAVIGLDVLAAIGTDVALMHLHGIAQKLKFKALQDKARERINQIAEERGLTAEELADRLVPDLDLDDSGTRELDFGPRQFRISFDEMLQPVVLAQDGERLGDLPKAKPSDDRDKAKRAMETWKALKADAKQIASGQLLRLEVAMRTQRRWRASVFRQCFLEHPLMVHVVRRLVWGVYRDQTLVGSFRLVEDGSFANAQDLVFELPHEALVGIVHRLDLDDGAAAAWGQLFGDYKIVQPFEQLCRATVRRDENEKGATALEKVGLVEVPTVRLLGLESRGWRRAPPEDGGYVQEFDMPIGQSLVATLRIAPGVAAAALALAPRQKLDAVRFTRDGGAFPESGWVSPEDVPPVLFSEVCRDLASLRS